MKKKRLFSVNVGTSLVLMAVGAALLSFGGLLQAQTQTYYTEFDFTGGVTVSDYMAQITTTGGNDVTIQVALANRERETTIAGSFDVVDAVQIEGGVWACQDTSTQDDEFGHYFQSPSDFSINPGDSNVYTFTGNFPRYYSGNYMGCILYYEKDAERDVNTVSRKALLVSANVASNEVTYTVKVYPLRKFDGSTATRTGYADSGMVRIYSLSNTGLGHQIYSTGVYINSDGYGSLSIIGMEPGTYNIVYKSWGFLASYISGFYISGSAQTFDFTTGDSLYGTQPLQINPLVDNGWRYQRPGDLPNAQGYDGVAGGAEISTILVNYIRANGGQYEYSFSDFGGYPFRADFNGNRLVATDDLQAMQITANEGGFTIYDIYGLNNMCDPTRFFNLGVESEWDNIIFDINYLEYCPKSTLH